MNNSLEHSPSILQCVAAKAAVDLSGHVSAFTSWQMVILYLIIFTLGALYRLAFLEWFSRKSPSVRRDLIQIFRSGRTRIASTQPRKRRKRPRN
jgi:hypothetical protein